MMVSPGVFFIFFQILIFWAVTGVKGQKIAQNEKEQLHLSRAISQEQYSIWSWFLVHYCKMMISPGVFFIFSKFWFFMLLGGGGVKGQNDKKFCHASYLRNHTSYDSVFSIWCVRLHGHTPAHGPLVWCVYKRSMHHFFLWHLLSGTLERRKWKKELTHQI